MQQVASVILRVTSAQSNWYTYFVYGYNDLPETFLLEVHNGKELYFAGHAVL